jgi:hypothetical protein
MEFIKRTWRDPVWSKVIATAICGGIVLLGGFFSRSEVTHWLGSTVQISGWALTLGFGSIGVVAAIVSRAAYRSSPKAGTQIAVTKTEGIIEMRGRDFVAERVEIDGRSFYNCTFKRCVMVYSGRTPVAMVGCTFSGSTFNFDGPAASAMHFLADMYHEFGDIGRAAVEDTFRGIRERSPEMGYGAV